MLSPFFPGHIRLIHTIALFFLLLMDMCKRHSVTVTPVDPVILIRLAVIKPTFRTDSTTV